MSNNKIKPLKQQKQVPNKHKKDWTKIITKEKTKRKKKIKQTFQ